MVGTTKTLVISVSALVFLALVPAANAEPLAAYDLVGLDPAGDAANMIAPGNDATPDTLSRGKQDITSLQMGDAGPAIHFKLNLVAPHAGTSSLLFVVFFKVEGTQYVVCWNIQSAGTTTQYSDVAEDMGAMACQRHTASATRVGPTTRANGIQVGADDMGTFVLWEVPKDSIGGGAAITDIVAETWNRGGNVDYAPATSPQSLYVWNLADRAPDAEFWTYGGSSAAATDLALEVEAASNTTTATGGENASYALNLTVIGNGTTSVTGEVEGLPPEFVTEVSFPSGSNATGGLPIPVILNVSVPQDVENQTLNFTFRAVGVDNISASVNLTLVAQKWWDEVVVIEDDNAIDSTASNDTSGAAPLEDENAGVPGPSMFVVLGAIAVVGAILRRRRLR